MANTRVKVELGKIYGYLKIIKETEPTSRGLRAFICKCQCGETTIAEGTYLLAGKRTSCGCIRHNNPLKLKHGEAKRENISRVYHCWQNMKDRCYNKNNNRYHRYGGRGIKVCKRWKNKENGFIKFFEDMGDKPKGMSINRINNDGNYTPLNCEWSTDKEQANNKNNNIMIEYKGKILPIRKACELSGVPFTTVSNRIRKNVPLQNLFLPTRPHKIYKNSK